MNRSFFLGVSMAASWAYGVSILVGWQILAQKGWIPFAIWALANSLVVPIFGYCAGKIKDFRRQVNNPVIKFLMVVVQFFVIWVEIKAIETAAMMTGVFTQGWATAFAVAVGIVFTLITYRNALNRAIVNDNTQWGIMNVALIVLIVGGIVAGNHFNIVPVKHNPADIHWAWYGALLLLGGPFMDIQQWQRAKLAHERGQQSAFIVAGLTFALYMAMLWLAKTFVVGGVMNWVIAIIITMVATTTLVSGTAALHEIKGKHTGFILGLICNVGYPLFMGVGMLSLWTAYGSFRLLVVVFMFLWAIERKVAQKTYGAKA